MSDVLEFKHGQNGGIIYLFPEMVLGCLFAPELKLVCVLGAGGATVPVAGTLDEIKQKLIEAKHTYKEVKDGVSIS